MRISVSLAKAHGELRAAKMTALKSIVVGVCKGTLRLNEHLPHLQQRQEELKD